MKSRNHAAGAAALLALLATACPTEPPQPRLITFYSIPSMDGGIVWNTTGVGDEYRLDDDSAGWVYAGDMGDAEADGLGDGVRRVLVSFELSALPAGATIQSATLRLYQNGQSAGDAYAATGPGAVYVSNIHYDALAATADLFGGAPTGTQVEIGPLASSFVADSWHEIDVTQSLADELAYYRNGTLQFRVYHDMENDNDDLSDMAGWATGNASDGIPELVVVYLE